MTLRCAGAYSGTIDARLADTVGTLRATLSTLTGGGACSALKIIAGGVVLSDDTRSLQSYRLTASSRLLVTRGAAAAAAVHTAEFAQERSAAREARLERIRVAALRLAQRDYDSSSFNVQLEAQDGRSFTFTDVSVHRAVVVGMVLHAHGRRMLVAREYSEAASALDLAVQAFDELAGSDEALGVVDNPAQAALDWCWAVYLAQDVSKLQQGTRRLQAAREGLARAHGADLSRLRTLVSSAFTPQLLAYVRLNLLEAILALHGGDVQRASAGLEAAAEFARPFQVDADAHAQFVAMGFTPQEATRGLRQCSGNMSQAVEWVLARRHEAAERRQRQREERRERRRLRAYGKTASGAYVDGAVLDKLTALEYDEDIAALALRDAENSFNQALDALLDPSKREALEDRLLRKRKRHSGRAAVPQLMELGYTEEQAEAALLHTEYDAEAAAELLLSGAPLEPLPPSSAAAAGPSDAAVEPVALSKEEEDAEAELAQEIEDPLVDCDVDISEELRILADYRQRVQSAISS